MLFRKILYITSMLIIVTIFISLYINKENWPEIKQDDSFNQFVEKSVKLYQKMNYDSSKYLEDYKFDGDYLTYGINKNFKEGDNLIFDEKGIPKVKYNDEFSYNPVTISQFALSEYGKIYKGLTNDDSRFINAIETLLDLQDDGGAFRYNFKYKYYLSGETYKEGWVSGMAQGQAISALVRAYIHTKEEKYFQAAEKAFQFLVLPKEEGGTYTTLADFDSSLEDYIFFEEYISTPNGYTLNGYMFTLLGIYDLWQLSELEKSKNRNLYKKYFRKGMKSLEKLLPYYDIGGFSAYDLGHYTYEKEPHVSARYHLVHIYLLHALYTVTENKTLKHYEELWTSYVDKN